MEGTFKFGDAKVIVLGDRHTKDKADKTQVSHTMNVRIIGNVKQVHLGNELIDVASLESGYNPLGLEIYDKSAEMVDELGYFELKWKTRAKKRA